MKAFFSSFKTPLFSLLFLLIATAGWGQTTIESQTFREGSLPSGWTTQPDVTFTSGANGYAKLSGNTAALISPVYDLTGYTNVKLSFSTAKFGTGTDGPIVVEISNDGGATWTAQTFNSPTPNSATYVNVVEKAVTVTGSSVKIRFTKTNSSSEKRFRNYVLVGTESATPPVITGDSVNGAYGSAITPYQIIASGTPTSYAVATGTLPAGLSLNTTTGVINGTPTVVGSSSVTVTAINANGTSPAATLNFVVAPKSVTISGLTGSNKIYDGSLQATVTGTPTLNGVLTADAPNVTISGAASYAFSNPNVGVAKPIVVTGITLSGTAAGNYTLIQPSDLTANITAKTVTVTGVVAQNKVYDGTLVAAISGGTLTGVIASDAANVSVSTVGTFATANVGTGIVVTVSLTGSASANYALTQPTVTADITKANQTITFNTIPALNQSSSPVDLNTFATASSGLALAYVSSNPLVVSISGNTLTVVGLGTATITASQAGNNNYNAAADAIQGVTVSAVPQVIAQFDFDSFTAATAIKVTQKNTNVIVTDFAISSGTLITGVTSGNEFPNEPYVEGTGGWTTATQAAAKNFNFNVTANPGYEIEVTSFEFNALSTAAGPSAIGFNINSDVAIYNRNAPDGILMEIDQAVVGVTNLTSIPVLIQGWLNGSRSSTGGGNLRIDDVILKGYVTCIKPVAYTITGVKNPCGTGAVFVLSDSEIGMNYQLLLNGVNSGSPIAGTGDLLSMGVANVAGTYTVVATNVYCTASTTMIGNVVLDLAGTTTWTGLSWNNGVPTSSDTAIIAANYSETANIYACSLIVNSNAVVSIPSGNSVTLNSALTVESGSTFTIESDANFIQRQSDAINTGNITVKRNSNIKRLDYVYWSSPVANQKFVDFSPQTITTRFLTYNEGTDKFDPVDNPVGNINTATFTPAKGYAVRAPNNHTSAETLWTGEFKGKPNNGDYTFDLIYKSGTLDPPNGPGNGYNLVGNPYPSNIVLDGDKGLFQANNGKIGKIAYFWNNSAPNVAQQGSSYTGENYAVYNKAGGAPATGSSVKPDGVVKLGQGFIVQALTASNTLTFTNSMRDGSLPSTFYDRKETQSKDRFWLQLTTPNQNFNTLLVAYVPEASNAFEIDYDAPMMGTSSDGLFSMLGNEKLSIQGRQYPLDPKDVVSLGSNHFVAGNYVISLQEAEGIFDNGQNIYLKDNQTNIITNLSQESYTFAAAEGLTEGRFEIVYQTNGVLDTNGVKKDELLVYRTGNDFVIKSTNKKISAVEVYDTSGRLILKTKPNQTEFRIDGSAMINGVYLLKIDRSGELTTKKITK